MIAVNKIGLFLLGCVMTTGFLSAQERGIPMRPPDLPRLYFDALSFSSDEPGLSRLDIYIQVPFDALRFTKRDELFRTAYDLTVDVRDNQNNLITERFWTENIETADYNESISAQSNKLSQRSFSLAPGTYSITVQLSDHETKKTTAESRKVIIPDFDRSQFSMSDIMLVRRLEVEEEKKIIYPNISGNVADHTDGFFLFFEVYDRLGADSARIQVDIKNVKGDVVLSDTSIQQLVPDKRSTFVKVNSDRLLAGDYILDARLFPIGPGINTETLVYSAASSHRFHVRWRGLPISISDLDQAIDQLQYVLEKEKIDQMKKAQPEEKRELFLAFWKKKDPTPNTERNELMEEYYTRVGYANKHFGHHIEGWKTDMGMVYIIFGAPSSIERHPFDIDSKPYEIWTYYELNREFVFIDATGFGDYRLQNPIWDLWRTRPR